MSGSSWNTDCPNCNTKDTLWCNSDWKPHDSVSGECVKCGYYFRTTNGFSTKAELIELRKSLGSRIRTFYTGKNKMEKW